MTLYLLRYNNYFNRMLKLKDSLEDYIPYMIGDTINNVNFNPNDGIWAEQVINWNNDIPDYLLVVDKASNINSRWFVIESTRTLGGQFKLTLFRDTLADYYDEIFYHSTMFIEKGIVNPSDPAIYNSEDITFNQIKTAEIPIKDDLESAWIVGYCSSSGDPENNRYSYVEDYSSADIVEDSLESWPLYKFSNLHPNRISNQLIQSALYDINIGRMNAFLSEYTTSQVMWNENQSNYKRATSSQQALPYIEYIGKLSEYNNKLNELANLLQASTDISGSKIADYLVEYYGTSDGFIKNTNLDGQTIYFDDTRKTYKIKYILGEYDQTEFKYINLVDGTELHQKIENIVNPTISSSDYFRINESGSKTYSRIAYYSQTCLLQLEEIPTQGAIGVVFPNQAKRNHLKDAPYDMFAIPYGDISVSNIRHNNEFMDISSTNKDVAFKIAQEIARKSGGTWVYDIQLLPFCPIPEPQWRGGRGLSIPFDTTNLDNSGKCVPIMRGTIENDRFTPSINEEDILSVVIFPDNSSFKTTTTIEDPSQLKDIKLRSEVEVYRITSPNYNGNFEFNKVKTGEYVGIDIFISCTYKPFTPFIQLTPRFDKLYGSNFNDNRGLICGGDFSMPIITSAWEQYQLNNRNFQNIFDRQIENIEVNNKFQRINERWGVATGTVSGALSGATTGGYVGGGYGAVAGAVVGAGASLAGGIADLRINEALRSEHMDYTKDLYGYQLGNIKALPNSLAKVSAFNINNKIFPTLEYYLCTSQEIEAFTEKIRNNGMTVMRIDYITNYLNYRPDMYSIFEYDESGEEIHRYGFLKAKLIRLDGINDDFHVVKTIANELNKGVFI